MSRRLKILTACGWTGGELPLIAERIIKEADKRMDAVRSLEPKFADIAVNKTVKVLMYDDVQAALQGEKE